MYTPNSFQVSEISILLEFIQTHSFATLISVIDGTPLATHLPLILDREESPQGILLGHMARANPHWRAFESKHESLIIFHGPHAYISPAWYVTSPAVPTWNYAVVHVYGFPKIVEDEAWLSKLLDRMVAVYEAGMAQPWSGDLPPDFKTKMLKMIIGFTIKIDRIEGQFKLGQNRSLEDRHGVVQHLESASDPVEQALGNLIKGGLAPKK